MSTQDDKDKATRQDRLLDGIQEYDNPMPRWWLLTFAGTVIFSVIYVFNVGPVGNGKGRIADYDAEMKAFAAAHRAPTGVLAGGPSSATLLAMVKGARQNNSWTTGAGWWTMETDEIVMTAIWRG